jgi:predicted amidohydrolase YtcJ
MRVEEAVRSFTTWAAYAAFEEGEKGSLEQGKLADFVVLSDDPFAVPPQALWDLRVERTVVGGRTVFSR